VSQPDLVRPIIAWRAWAVHRKGPPRLESFNGAPWPPHHRMEARCNKSHEPPGVGCRCGLYAAKDKPTLIELGYQHYGDAWFAVIGTVKLWGGLIPAEWGYRAEYGYPATLHVPYEIPDVAIALRRTYGVRVRLSNNLALIPNEEE